jgi:hypothetical protein
MTSCGYPGDERGGMEHVERGGGRKLVPEINLLPLDGFWFDDFSKICPEIPIPSNPNNNNRYFTCSRPIYIFNNISLSSS